MKSNMLELLNIYVHVVECGSFIRASEAMQLSRPVISKAVMQLEKEMGVRLLHRTTRSLNLTAEGEDIYTRAKGILSDVNDMMNTSSLMQPPRGRLRIDAPLALTHCVLIPALHDFQARFPDVDITLMASDRIADMVSEGIDCVIRMGALADSESVSRLLGYVEMVTCASPGYITRYGLPDSPDALVHHKAVNFFSDHSREIMEWHFTHQNQARSYRPRSGILVNNSDALITCGKEGMGIIHVPLVAVESQLKKESLSVFLKITVRKKSRYRYCILTVTICQPERGSSLNG